MGLFQGLFSRGGARYGKDYVVGVSYTGSKRMYLELYDFSPDPDHLYLLETECARLAYGLGLDSTEKLEFVIEPRSGRFDPTTLISKLGSVLKSIDEKRRINHLIKEEFELNPLMRDSLELLRREEEEVYYRSAKRSGRRLMVAAEGYLRQSRNFVP